MVTAAIAGWLFAQQPVAAKRLRVAANQMDDGIVGGIYPPEDWLPAGRRPPIVCEFSVAQMRPWLPATAAMTVRSDRTSTALCIRCMRSKTVAGVTRSARRR